MHGVRFLQGNIACAEGAIAAGCRFFAGYPITPSTEIAEWLSQRLPKEEGVFIQMEDEIGSIAAMIGARWAGAKAMTSTSGPGFSLMMENIGFAAMTETPIVIVNIQRSGPSTGQPTMPASGDVMQARYGSHGDYAIIALSPNSVQEMFELTVEAFNLSERYRVPAFLMADEVIGHMREKVTLPESVETFTAPLSRRGTRYYFKPDPRTLVPKMQVFGKGYNVHVTGLTHDERGYPATNDAKVHTKLVRRLVEKIERNAEEIIRVEEHHLEDAEVVLIAYGAVSRSALAAVRELRERGVKAGLLRLITLFPFPEKLVARLARRSRLVVLEMNLGQMLREVQRVSRRKVHFLPRIGGELHTPREIVKFVEALK
ncbi:2-oxoacid:acceptor oxidoreductase subunit alpha [Candidatus Pyrohabitans sp.]